MDAKSCKWFGRNEGGDCRGVSPGTVFYDFVTNNVSMPSELGEILAYVLLLVISWYAVIYVFRFVLSLVKPVLIVVAALFLFRFLRTFESTDIKDLFIHFVGLVMSGVTKAVELFMRILD